MWAERQSAYQHFYSAFVLITEALEMIGFKHHLDKYAILMLIRILHPVVMLNNC